MQYSGGRKGLQFSNKDMWKTDLGARLNILKGKGTFGVRFNDIFKTMKARFYSYEPANISGTFEWESQTVNVNFSYRFGSGKNRALDRKQRDKNEKQGGGMF
jgi:Outer membrane protein beta-barrel family